MQHCIFHNTGELQCEKPLVSMGSMQGICRLQIRKKKKKVHVFCAQPIYVRISMYTYVCFRKFAFVHKCKSEFATNNDQWIPACCGEGCHSQYFHSTPKTSTSITLFLSYCFPVCSSTEKKTNKPAPSVRATRQLKTYIQLHSQTWLC